MNWIQIRQADVDRPARRVREAMRVPADVVLPTAPASKPAPVHEQARKAAHSHE